MTDPSQPSHGDPSLANDGGTIGQSGLAQDRKDVRLRSKSRGRDAAAKTDPAAPVQEQAPRARTRRLHAKAGQAPDQPEPAIPTAAKRRHHRPDPRKSLIEILRPHPFASTVAAMLTLLIVLGGGGTLNPMTEILVEVGIGLILAAMLIMPRLGHGAQPIPAQSWLLVSLVLIVPVIQLIPLPPGIWHALPDRTPEIAALSLVGADNMWMPLSLTPFATMAALLGMMAICAFHLCVSRLDLHGRTTLCLVIAMLALLSMVVGALQLGHVGGLPWSFYAEIHEGWMIGFHSNRNAETETLQVAILALAVVFVAVGETVRRQKAAWPVFGAAVLMLILGTFLTGSRAGIALLPVTLLFTAAILMPVLRGSSRALWTRVGGLIVAVALGGAVLLQFPVIGRVVERFGAGDEARGAVWDATLFAARQSWPAGTGIGSFPTIYPTIETLESLITENVPHAHNDWLEWLLESGAAGCAAAIALAALVLWRMIASRPGSTDAETAAVARAQWLFATATLIHIGLHAIVDFPIRIMTLAAFVALSAAFFMPLPQNAKDMAPDEPVS